MKNVYSYLEDEGGFPQGEMLNRLGSGSKSSGREKEAISSLQQDDKSSVQEET